MFNGHILPLAKKSTTVIARSSDIFLNKTATKKTTHVPETTVKKTKDIPETTDVPETTVKTTQTTNSSTNAAQNKVTTSQSTILGKSVGKFWQSYLL